MEVHASLKAEDVFLLGPIPITNSMMMAWLAILVLGVFAYFAGRNPQLVPTGAQNLFEAILEPVLSMVENNAGHYARRIFPLVATLFVFIITANSMNILPGVGTIWVVNPHLHQQEQAGPALARVAEASPLGAAPATVSPAPAAQAGAGKERETVPLFRAANADLNMTVAMGLIAFFFIHASGIYVHGLVGYVRDDLANPILLTPVKIAIELFVPVSLSMRLFGNIFGGETLLTVMNLPLAGVPFMLLELFFGFIQAVIFAILTLIFTSIATYLPAGHGEAAHGAPGAPGAPGAHGEHAGGGPEGERQAGAPAVATQA
jgi:F-type H+-transporting ATPase subunit a